MGEPVVLGGRTPGCRALDGLLDARAGQSGTLVLRGEARPGKPALLEYVAEPAVGWLVARATGGPARPCMPWSGKELKVRAVSPSHLPAVRGTRHRWEAGR
ncbi:MAG: hypothetical protein ACRDN0_37070 [Trebonia sp.]